MLIENVFIRSADDAIAVKGLDATRDTKDVVVRDSFFFPHGNCMEVRRVTAQRRNGSVC